MTLFGDRLRCVMKLMGLQVDDVVEDVEKFSEHYNLGFVITAQEMNSYLAGESVPSADKLVILSKVLYVQPSYFEICDMLPIFENLSQEENRLINCWRIASKGDKAIVAMTLSNYGFYLDD